MTVEIDSGSRTIAVNVGEARIVEVNGHTVRTAVWKAPVEGRVQLRGVNLRGDEQADRTVHGGPHKTVYAYGIEDIEQWESELAVALGPGASARTSRSAVFRCPRP